MESKLTVRETLEMYAGYYRSPRDVAATIELVGLAEKADDRNGKLSGGQQRRLDVAVALSATPSCSSSTSRRPASTPPPGATSGR